jgi:hypothetical protein
MSCSLAYISELSSPPQPFFLFLFFKPLLTFSEHIKTHVDLVGAAQTLSGPVTDPSKLPKWNYDGSSTGQAPGEDSEVIL